LGSTKGGWRDDLDTSGAFIPEISGTVTSKWAKGGGPAGDELYNLVPAVAHTLRAEGADAIKILRTLRCEIGAEAFAEWGSRISDPLQSAPVLRTALLRAVKERGIPGARDGQIPRSLSGAIHDNEAPMQQLREDQESGRAPQGPEPPEQFAGESRSSLPVMSHEAASPEEIVHRLWSTPEGARLLQQALDQIQEVWRSIGVNDSDKEEMSSMRETGAGSGILRETLHATETGGDFGEVRKEVPGVISAVRRLTPR
jgi:hypothetical protein